jgi:hypothetical protein
VVEPQEHRDLKEHRQAARERVEALLLLEPHQLPIELCPVALVLRPKLLQLRLHPLHVALEMHLLDEHSEQQQPGRDHQ